MKATAVVFDCDGVLIDSEGLSWQAWKKLLGRYGIEATEEEKSLLLGRTVSDIYAHFRGSVALPVFSAFRRELSAEVVRAFERELRVFEDGIELVWEAKRRDLRLAVASSSEGPRLRRSLELAGLSNCFEVIVAGDEVANGKPAPDLYLAAAKRLGVKPRECVAVEDSPIGVTAAAAAGMTVLAVIRAHTDRRALSGADVIVEKLDETALDTVLFLSPT